GKFGAAAEVLQACLKIDAALSMVYFDSATELEFRRELANAVCAFASSHNSELGAILDDVCEDSSQVSIRYAPRTLAMAACAVAVAFVPVDHWRRPAVDFDKRVAQIETLDYLRIYREEKPFGYSGPANPSSFEIPVTL